MTVRSRTKVGDSASGPEIKGCGRAIKAENIEGDQEISTDRFGRWL